MTQTAQSAELQSTIATIRAKVAAGTATIDDLKAGIAAMRQDRVGATYASETSKRKKAAVAIPSADDLLAGLGEELM